MDAKKWGEEILQPLAHSERIETMDDMRAAENQGR